MIACAAKMPAETSDRLFECAQAYTAANDMYQRGGSRGGGFVG